MSEQTQAPTEAEQGTVPNAAEQLATLKSRADTMGIPYHPSIGLDALRKKVSDRLNGVKDEEAVTEQTPQAALVPDAVRPKTAAEKEADIRRTVRADALALVRCKIYNLNPQKRDLKGEIITVANKYIGKVSKFIPFGDESEGGYHIEKVLYDDLLQRQYLDLRSKEVNGKTVTTQRMVPEYNVVVLPMLTKEELAELALKQETAARLEA